jgi:threonine synthase
MTTSTQLDESAGLGPELLPPDDSEDRGLWRYRKLLPVGHEDPIAYPHPVGCQPLVDAWRERRAPVTVEPNTIADGVAVGAPVLGEQALRDVRESAGAFLSVTDEAIVEAMQLLAGNAGVVAEPTGAPALAGFGAALESGLIDRDEEVVIEVTGSGFKTAGRLRADRGPIECVGADLDEVREILGVAVAGAVR